MNAVLKIAPIAMVVACSAYAQNIAGDWQGALNAGSTDLRIVLHFTSADNGASGRTAFRATMDSLDQSGPAIPVSSVSLADSILNLAIDTAHATYQGKVNADATAIEGTFMQGGATPLNFARLAPSDIDGAWQGALDFGGTKLRVVLHLANTATGMTATPENPDPRPVGKSATNATRDGTGLAIEWNQLGAKFEGKTTADRTSINGTFTQNGNSYPLSLHPLKSEAGIQRRRPQTPEQPYPYKAEDVAYRNNSAGISLAGTLTLPQGEGRFPAAILIPGSGPHDRDETIEGHRPFLVLADYLARQGIAVLRADDRGVGSSGGDFAASTSADLATDWEAGLAYLKTRAEIDPRRIGLIGHSEGGMIAPMIASRNHDVAFIVMMAGQGVTGEKVLLEQGQMELQASGASKAQLDAEAVIQRILFRLVKENMDKASLAAKAKVQLGAFLPETEIGEQVAAIGSPWFRFYLEYDPASALRKLKCPVLAMIGEKGYAGRGKTKHSGDSRRP